MTPRPKIKVVFFGEPNSGKSNIIHFNPDMPTQQFSHDNIIDIGTLFLWKKMGMLMFYSLIPQYRDNQNATEKATAIETTVRMGAINKPDCIFLAVDSTDENWKDKTETWINKIRNHVDLKNIPITLVGTKTPVDISFAWVFRLRTSIPKDNELDINTLNLYEKDNKIFYATKNANDACVKDQEILKSEFLYFDDVLNMLKNKNQYFQYESNLNNRDSDNKIRLALQLYITSHKGYISSFHQELKEFAKEKDCNSFTVAQYDAQPYVVKGEGSRDNKSLYDYARYYHNSLIRYSRW